MSAYAATVPPGAQLRRIARPGGDIAAWVKSGSGAPLLFVHGNTASKTAFRTLLAEPALKGRAWAAMDLPGAGESENAADPAAAYTIPAFARAVGDTIAAFGLDRPVVMGWSLGGHIAIEAAGQGVPMRGLVITGTPPCGPGPAEMAESFNMEALGEVAIAENPTREVLTGYIGGKVYGQSVPVPDELFEAGYRFDARARTNFANHWLSAVEGHHARTVIAEWPHPIAVIQGDLEPFLDPTLLDRLAWRNRWRGKSQWIPGTGHAPFFERPADYAALLAAFLDDIEQGRLAPL